MGPRQVTDVVACKFQSGTPCRHLPQRYGNWQAVRSWLRTALVAQADADKDLIWAVSVKSTIARTHQNASRARDVGRPASRMTGVRIPVTSPSRRVGDGSGLLPEWTP